MQEVRYNSPSYQPISVVAQRTICPLLQENHHQQQVPDLIAYNPDDDMNGPYRRVYIHIFSHKTIVLIMLLDLQKIKMFV